MEIKNYKNRIIDSTLDLYLDTFGAVLIEGPKWCGKTWTARKHSNSEILLADSSGNFSKRQLAMMNPNLVLDGARPRLIDEWQEVPPIWDAVRSDLDVHPQKGKYLLTGSATIDKSRYIHSGTGRIARLKMRTMSLYESGYSNGKISLLDICLNRAPDCFTGDVELDTLLNYILVGGWPSTIDESVQHGSLIAKKYMKAVLNEDIFKVDDVKRNPHKVELLLKSLARNEATCATNKALINDIRANDCDEVSVNSITDYLDLLNRLYLTENIPPFSSRLRSSIRVKQAEKRHFVDPSLPCALLNLTKEKMLSDMELLGFLFESMVERDLLTYVESFGGKLFHYQDYNGHEMDAVIEMEDGSWCGIEIKLGANRIEEAATNLKKINDIIGKEGGKTASSLCVICGLSSAAYRRPDGVYVVPITSLKN